MEELQIPKVEDVIAQKIVRYYGYFEENFLKSIAKKSAKLVLGEYFGDICADMFEILSPEEMEEWVLEELNRDFDEKVVGAVERFYPDLSGNDLDQKLIQLEKMYVREHQEQLKATTKVAIKELRTRVIALRKDVNLLRRKYTL
jgi:hypothetical protein